MEKEVLDLIEKRKLFKKEDTVGVAVSGGMDSMCLLHFLNAHKKDLGISIVAITVNHMLRGKRGKEDSDFVVAWCKKRHIPCLEFTVNSKLISERQKVGVEEGARIARYDVFDKLLKKARVDKIAIAHHLSDQAETILMHILRGSGVHGARGMEVDRKDGYVRPFLYTPHDDICKYAKRHKIKFIQDESNFDDSFDRNFLRNEVFPKLRERWKGVEHSLVNFGESCTEDDNFILKYAKHDGMIIEGSVCKIPLTYFNYDSSVINRIIFDALTKIGVTRDIQRKHIELIRSVVNLENGKRVSLPYDLVARREYEYLTLYRRPKVIVAESYPFKVGKTNFGDIYDIEVRRTKKFEKKSDFLIADSSKIPPSAVWRVRKIGDKITKFGGESRSLKAYLIDKKVPKRVRDTLPILASGNEVLCVLGVDISSKIKVDKKTKSAYQIYGHKVCRD